MHVCESEYQILTMIVIQHGKNMCPLVKALAEVSIKKYAKKGSLEMVEKEWVFFIISVSFSPSQKSKNLKLSNVCIPYAPQSPLVLYECHKRFGMLIVIFPNT